MKRMQLFEFEDSAAMPLWMRNCLTAYLLTIHRMLDTASKISPLVGRLLSESRSSRVVDLCSGAGGPMEEVFSRLQPHHPSLELLMTDRFPNEAAIQRVEAKHSRIRYRREPVDAGNIPPALQGVRTMVCSFHHMPLPTARAILRDTFEKKQPFLAFEISDNSQPKFLWWTAFPVGIFFVFFLTPWVRPFTWRQFVFTYVIPILPIVVAWDGAASNARTYTQQDLEELIRSHASPEYRWEIGLIPAKIGKMLYLLGSPTNSF